MLYIGNKPEITFKTHKQFSTIQATFGLNPDFCIVLSTSQTYYDDFKNSFHEIKIVRKVSLKVFISHIRCNIDEVFVFEKDEDRIKFSNYRKSVLGRNIFGRINDI
ncbi:hypothetical protein CDIK_1214 [Cucumispora dikerogammari]|nr:hypothetical protein CDIK_1214 [Cucumispora dikerogammari]